MISDDIELPSPFSLGAEAQQILHNQVIDEAGPGAILKDFEVLLRFIGPEGVSVGGKHYLLPMKALADLNAQLTHPIKLDLKRPLLKSYPNISGLYLLLRSSGLAYVEPARTRGLLRLEDAAIQSWRELNPTERYFSLLETWLLRSSAEFLGERESVLDQPVLRWADFFRRMPPEGLAIAGNQDLEGFVAYYPGLYTVALLELFGFISVQAGEPESGKGWRIAWVVQTPWGGAMLQLLSESLPGGGYLFRRAAEVGAGFGELQPLLQPFFPGWRRNLSLPQPEFQDGTYIFKVSLERGVWRRIAIAGSADFESLSDAILQAFDFDDDHLYQFTCKDRFGISVDINHPYMDEEPFTDETHVREVGLKPGDSMTYLYDFGDHWEFALALESIEAEDPELDNPRVLESHGESPEQYPEWDDE